MTIDADLMGGCPLLCTPRPRRPSRPCASLPRSCPLVESTSRWAVLTPRKCKILRFLVLSISRDNLKDTVSESIYYASGGITVPIAVQGKCHSRLNISLRRHEEDRIAPQT